MTNRHFEDLKAKLLGTVGDFRGATGEFPAGQLGPDDDGELQLAVTVKNGVVLVDFGTTVKWIGMDPQQAADLAGILLAHAHRAARETGQDIIFSVGRVLE